MARTWLAITVELLGGRGEELWPAPGRTFAVGPGHTFMDFAEAINTAFARWDHAHLSEFALADGTLVADVESSLDLVADGFGPVQVPLEITRARVTRTVKPGDAFRFTFDLGDNWTHRCTVHASKVDPLEVLGIVPDGPLPYWGWGDMPDQYGRRWSDDCGDDDVPPQPARRDPMREYHWPPRDTFTPPNLDEVRAAIRESDRGAFLAAITGHNIDEDLQHVAAGALLLGSSRNETHQAIAFSIASRLRRRGAAGDQELSESLFAQLRAQLRPQPRP